MVSLSNDETNYGERLERFPSVAVSYRAVILALKFVLAPSSIAHICWAVRQDRTTKEKAERFSFRFFKWTNVDGTPFPVIGKSAFSPARPLPVCYSVTKSHWIITKGDLHNRITNGILSGYVNGKGRAIPIPIVLQRSTPTSHVSYVWHLNVTVLAYLILVSGRQVGYAESYTCLVSI